jgi:predicted DCC family thiol-disulfide oxidoreductase YuxK
MTNLTVWFDGACPLCQREIAAMRRLDRSQRITFLDVTDVNTACPIDRGELLARFHAREDGMLLSGAAAFAAMWRAIPLLRPFGLAARNAAVLRALEWLYMRFLRYRPALQRWVRDRDSSAHG